MRCPTIAVSICACTQIKGIGKMSTQPVSSEWRKQIKHVWCWTTATIRMWNCCRHRRWGRRQRISSNLFTICFWAIVDRALVSYTCNQGHIQHQSPCWSPRLVLRYWWYTNTFHCGLKWNQKVYTKLGNFNWTLYHEFQTNFGTKIILRNQLHIVAKKRCTGDDDDRSE